MAEPANTIEMLLGEAGIDEPEGLWPHYATEPVATPKRPMYVLDRTDKLRAVGSIEDLLALKTEISAREFYLRSLDGDKVLTPEQVSKLQPRSWPLSSRATRLVKAVIETVIMQHGVWGYPINMVGRESRRRVSYDMIPVISQFLKEGYDEYVELDERSLVVPPNRNIALYDAIVSVLMSLREELMNFLGQDRWIMHFTSYRYGTATIEKTVDYRIHAWMKEHLSDLPIR